MATLESKPAGLDETVSKGPDRIQVENPATGQVIGEVDDLSPEQVKRLVATARAAQPAWEATSFAERAKVLKRAQKWLLDHADRLGKHLRDGLAHPHVTEVRGEGLLIGLSLDAERAPATVAAAQDAGFILNACSPDRVRLAPPLVLTDDEADELLAAWPAILAAAYEEVS